MTQASSHDPRDVDRVIQAVRLRLYHADVEAAVGLLEDARREHPDPRYGELLERIHGWMGHLEGRDAYVAAQEDQYRRLRWRRDLKFLERQFRVLTGRKARKMIRKRLAHPEFHRLDAEVMRVGARRVLDGGAGEGAMAMALATRHPELTIDAVDASATNVRISRRMSRFSNLSLHHGLVEDVHQMFPRDAYDLVYSIAVLEHVRSVEQAVESLLHVLRPGGRICFVVPMTRFEPVGELPEFEPTHGYCDHVRCFTEPMLRSLFGRYQDLMIDRIDIPVKPGKLPPFLRPVESGSFFFAFTKSAS